MADDPPLTLGLTERHEQQIGPRQADAVQEGLLLPPASAPERRALGTDDLEPRVAGDQPPRRLLRHPLIAAEQEDAESLASGLLAEVEDQVASRHPLRQAACPASRDAPHQRRAVGHDERRPLVDRAQVGQRFRQHRVVRGGRDEERRRPAADQPRYRRNRLVNVIGANGTPQTQTRSREPSPASINPSLLAPPGGR